MNKIFRLIWSMAKEKWVVVSEKVAARGCCPAATVGALTLAALFAAGGNAFALDPGALPTGGKITSGSGSIATGGNQMTVNQTTQQMITNWNSFNIGQNAGVQFKQPSSTATALNRINDQNPSQILGSLSANGNVFLLNPAGIIFGQTARVDVGGLVASSLSMLDSDFLAGKYTFTNAGNAGSILNQGVINAIPGGVVALIASKVINEGAISANSGSVALAAGNQVSLDFKGDGLITYTVDQGAVDALVDNKGLIKADGGLVVMTAKAADSLTSAVVNNSGVIEAQALANKGGRILLLSDMDNGQTVVSGTLDASAPNGGDGGFVETSGGRVKIGDNTKVDTRAAQGKTGMWLLDPTDFTIGVDESGASVSDSLATTDRTIQADNNINVNDNVTWNANTLTLQTTSGDVNINAVMTANDTAALDLEPGSGKVNVGMTPDGLGFTGRVDFFQADGVTPRSGTGFLTINGNGYTVINELGGEGSTTGSDLQGINGDTSGYFALGSNIDATATSGWNYGEGFMPIGTYGAFTGIFDGLGHTISNLTVNRPGIYNQGLFGAAYYGTLRNVGLPNLNVTGYGKVGGLVGYGWYTTIGNSYATGSVSAGNYATGVGGLMGYDYGGSNITNSHAAVNVTAGNYSRGVGGLVGSGWGYGSGISITNSSSTGDVTAVNSTGVGGLMGYGYAYNSGSIILDSYATGKVTGGNYVGGLVGYGYDDSITNSYATGDVSGTGDYVGGLVGYSNGNPLIDNSYATGKVGGNNYVGGLVGYMNNGTINNSHAIGDVSGTNSIGGLVGYGYYSSLTDSYATGAVTAGAYNSNVGGLVGYLYGSGSSIAGSYATGAVLAGNYSSNIGGLVGRNDGGSVTDSHAIGNVTAGAYSDSVGGLVGNNYTSGYGITNSYATGTVTADANFSQNVGGLVGYNSNNSSIDNSYATGPVTGNNYVGGLVGYDNGNTITNSHAIGAVSGAYNIGGLVGYGWNSTIGSSYATGAVTAGTYSQNIGGLVGYMYNWYGTGSIVSSYATGPVAAGAYSSDVGGLVGYNDGNFITDSHAGGNVTAGNYSNSVGGLVGYNTNSPISNSYATGTVTAGAINSNAAGGLVGYNSSSAITASQSTGAAVSGGSYVGGLVGQNNSGTITNSQATGAVTGTGDRVGGLVGENYASDINNSYATGTTINGNNDVGGLVGFNFNSIITNSFATSAVTGSGNNVGGLVGNLYGWYGTNSITNSYATGPVTGVDSVGGLVGNVYAGGYGAGNTITTTYAAGVVTGSSSVGGLVGGNSGPASVIASFWDTTVNPALADNGFGTGKTTTELKTLTTFADAGWDIDASGGTPAVWRIYDGNTMPLLRNFLTPLTITADSVTKTYDGTAYSSTTAYTPDLTGVDTSQILGSVSSPGINVGSSVISAGNLYSTQFGYDISSVDGSLTVNPAPLTVTASNATKTYGQTASFSGTEFTPSGLQNGETIGSVTLASAGTAATAGVSGSPYTITASNASGGTFNAGNYTITYNNGALTVTPASLTVTASDASKTYGQTPTLSSFTSSGLQNGETIGSVTLASAGTAATAGVSGSPYTITASNASGGTFSAGNYTITYNNGALTVTPAPLSVTANDDAKNYSGIPYAGGNGATYSGFVNGEGSDVLGGTLTYGGTSQGAINAGTYTIIPGGFTGGNYQITYSNGALTITGSGTPIPTTPTPTTPVPTGVTAAASHEEPIQVPPLPPQNADPFRQLGPSTMPPPSVINSQTPASRTDTAGGPAVHVVSQPTTQEAGIINVTVPGRLARPGSGFSFLLPEEVSNAAVAGAVTETVSLPDGSQLPVWLKYYPDSKRFVASDVPAGSLPITVIVLVGGQKWLVEITAQQDI
ncbi:MAG: hypothetical protein CXR31_09285 [Geobacter sp.]|nr:MAG: hypothetical protein CXR31_09285 [Geobacter sp.]